MTLRTLLTLTLICFFAISAHANTTIVEDDFESYANAAALLGTWQPYNPTLGFHSDNGTMLVSEPNEFYGNPDEETAPELRGIDGQAAEFCGSEQSAAGEGVCGGVAGGGTVNRWNATFSEPVVPTETQNVELTVDIGDDSLSANKRLTIGLRNTANVQNILEMGLYNGPSGFVYRAQNFGVSGGNVNPNWVSFADTAEIDVPLSEELNTQDEAGSGFHTFKAIISVDQIVFTLDLYGDGLTNDPAAATPGVGVAGVDAMDTVSVATSANGFDDLRFGIPSHLPSSGVANPDAAFAAFDNIKLELVDIIPGATDTEPDGDVDGTDFLTLQRDDPSLIPQWQLDYPSPLSAITAVPEPTAVSLTCLALASAMVVRRR